MNIQEHYENNDHTFKTLLTFFKEELEYCTYIG